MNVAIYFSPLGAVGRPTGVGVHIVRMAEQLATWSGLSTTLLANRQAYHAAQATFPQAVAAMPVTWLPGPERLTRRLALASRWFSVDRGSGPADWVYCPKEQPVATRRAKLAVTVHDVLAFEDRVAGLEHSWRPLTTLRWRLVMRRILQRASLIATVSEFTRRRLLELFRIKDEDRLVVVGNGVSAGYFAGRAAGDADTLKRFGLTCESYLMTVGGLTRRKGGDLLIELAQRLHERRLPWRIVVTGRRHDDALLHRYSTVRASIPDLPLDLPGFVPDEVQAVLLRNAAALVFPSRYEGFGIPVVEAMAAGTPVVCSNAAALPEIAGGAARLVESWRAEEWLERVMEVAESSGVRQSLIEAGRRRASAFTWHGCASKLVSAMGKAG